MCGIAGWYNRGGSPVAQSTIRQACQSILHRGPDDEGILTEGDFGFGMRRLSIIDLASGHQPIESEDGQHAIIFNGEIYNHLELRKILREQGYRFRTDSDTETILQAYRHWGDAAWSRLEGMFAVAIWSRHQRQLTLTRDPLGIKPLYVTEQNGGLAFASELKALLHLPGHHFDLSPRALHDFFCFGHIRSPRSIYTQVRTLPPGHVLHFGVDGHAKQAPFWQARFQTSQPRSEGEWIEEFRARWLATVKRHMLADVEIGAFLSGGIDSSAVVAAMAQLTKQPVRTFTIGFPVERFNEAPAAEAVARHLGTRHLTQIVDLQAATSILPVVQACYDEPFADPSAVPTWYVSQMAAQHVKVALSGDGGDEVFMGYRRHLTERRLAALPAAIRYLARVLTVLPPTSVPALNYVLQRWQKAARNAALPDGISRFFAATQITSPALRERIYSKSFRASFNEGQNLEQLREEYFPDPAEISHDSLEQFAYADLTLNLPSAMLTKVDRASMAHSLEVRVPMLSPPLVKWALTLPTDMKLRAGKGKHIVRQAITPWLPTEVLSRPKQGFKMPLSEWFSGDFGRYAREIWHDSQANHLGILDSGEVESLFTEHSSGLRDHSRILYAIAMFSLWWAGQQSRVSPLASTLAG